MRALGGAPVVVAGPDGPTVGVIPPCVACGATEGTRVPAVLDETGAVVLCRDATACAERYRSGMSAESYGAALRGELLAVAP